MPRFSLSKSDLEDEEKENEMEPAHPIGFGSPWGRTWMSLDPPPIISPGQARYAFDLSDDEDDDLFKKRRQSYPSLSSYISSKTVSTKTLLQYREPYYDGESSDEEQSSFLRTRMAQHQRTPIVESASLMAPSQPLPSWSETNLSIQQKIELERRRLKQEHMKANQEVQDLVQDLEQQVALIMKDREDEEDARRKQLEGQRLREEEDAKQEAMKIKGVALLEEKERAKRIAAENEHKKKDSERAEARRKASQPAEWIMKGKKLVAQLVELRKSIEPFDKHKAVSKRRLQMKKIVRGKVNTLSEDASKVQEVAMEVSQAISAARQEDEQIKQRLENKEPGFTSDMARGKRYMVDLLASNVMQRVQAESFNGPRGDGFPLAAMAAMISLENKELVPILAAHIYTVCPIAIPTLPNPTASASEDDLMSSLGMLKDKNGEFESWDRFSSRTESIVAMVANITASSPSTHTLLGGHQGAADWLTRFLDLLPPPPTSPLPLLTAPVLHAFLSGAGNMLAHKHPESFRKNLETITTDIVKRLDEGEIGKPSSIRLNKLLERGFDGFRSMLPSKAIPELYYGEGGGKSSGSGGGTVSSSMLSSGGGASSQGGFGNAFSGSNSTASASPFGKPSSANPFGGGDSGGGGSFATPAVSARSSPSSKPFGGNSSNPDSNPFGGGNTRGHQNTSSVSTASPFSNPGIATSAASNTFGGDAPASQTPFGSSTQASISPFGGESSSGFGASNSAGFGASGPNVSPFGGPSNGFSSNSTTNPSPFGVASGSTTSNNSFGGNQGSVNQSQYGNPSPFSGGSSFGGGNQSGNNQSGNNNGSFTSNSSAQKKKAPCRFFAKGNCRFGDKCRFSHEGGGGGEGGGFGGGTKGGGFGNNTNSGFGGGGNRGGDGFGNNNSGTGGNNPFGGGGFNSNQRSPFG
jgi:hypothetical protein